MQKNEDGSVTLTKQELSKLNKAYQALYNILNGMPACLGDYFKRNDDYMNVVEWRCKLEGEEFRREDWE